MTKWPVQKPTHRTTQKHVEHEDPTIIAYYIVKQSKILTVVSSFSCKRRTDMAKNTIK